MKEIQDICEAVGKAILTIILAYGSIILICVFFILIYEATQEDTEGKNNKCEKVETWQTAKYISDGD